MRSGPVGSVGLFLLGAVTATAPGIRFPSTRASARRRASAVLVDQDSFAQLVPMRGGEPPRFPRLLSVASLPTARRGPLRGSFPEPPSRVSGSRAGAVATGPVPRRPVPVASVHVTPATATLQENQTLQLWVVVKDVRGKALHGRGIRWTSSDAAVALVSTSGLVRAKGVGNATITATSEGVVGTAAIAVTLAPVATVDVTPAPAEVIVGETVQLTATTKDVNGEPLVGRAVTWASSDERRATVSSSGLVSAVGLGAVIITATSEGHSGLSAVMIAEPAPAKDGVVLVGAGDIGGCLSNGDEATAELLDDIPGTVFTAGDNAYPDGSAAAFADCYDASWGRHKARTRPAPGNHDYHTAHAAPYYAYFGDNAGPADRGYYSYDLGAWHIVSLNSSIGMGAGSAQEQWLRADLAASKARCTLAYWHRPRFSAGEHGSSVDVRAVWEALYDYGAEVVINGHDHNYQRFAPQTSAGVRDDARGIREFVVGTGGGSHYGFIAPVPNTEAYNADTFGVLKLTLYPDRYEWEFVPVLGKTYTDSGSTACH